MTWRCEWRHASEARAEDLGRFEKSQLSWVLRTEREGSTFGARRGQTSLRATGAARDGGGADGKVIIERLCLSLPYVETFNSKVIKGFVPELRSRYVFFVFRNSYVLCIYILWRFYVRFTYPYHAYGTVALFSNNYLFSLLPLSSLFCIMQQFHTGTLAQRLGCSPMARETWVQSQVESY